MLCQLTLPCIRSSFSWRTWNLCGSTIQQILEEADFLVLPAANAVQALELAQSCAGSVDLLITNLHPEGMPGPDLAFHLRKRSPEMSVLYSFANPLAALEIPDPVEMVSSMLPGHLVEQPCLPYQRAPRCAHVTEDS